MSHYTATKVPHPIQDPRIADYNRRMICEVRGFCGPFMNQAFYDSFPDPIWRGTGECIVCCNTCNVEVEERKQKAYVPPPHPGSPAHRSALPAMGILTRSMTPRPPA